MTKVFLCCQSLYTFILFSTSIYVIVIKSIHIDQTSLLLILCGIAMFIVSILCLRSIHSGYKNINPKHIIPIELVQTIYINMIKVDSSNKVTTKVEDIKIEDVNEDDIGGPV